MNITDFEYIARLLKEQSGLILSKDKAYLLESRLNPVARKWEFKGFDELAAAVRTSRNDDLVRDITEAMTTNESFFFRDSKPFDQFRDVVLPQLLEARKGARSIRIWSAACSSGQEPYSLAMILKEHEAKLQGWKIDIVATDLSNEILAKAREGLYSQFEVQRGLPINLLVKYFKQEGDRWRISDAIRQMVKYECFNLLESPSRLGKFDVVFCRNVLIYFDQPTKSMILDRIAGLLTPDGFLYLGGAETVLGLTERFRLVPGQRGLYGPAPADSAAPAKAVG
ncbi:MAG: CheR family methyltransferase [Kiloniellales bacterium]